MIITILIGLLGTFLDYWFMKWLKEHFGGVPKDMGPNANWRCPTQDEVQSAKSEFMNRVSRPWHFILGWNRVEKAGILFDRAAARYQPNQNGIASTEPSYYQAFYTGNFKSLIKTMTDGLSVT